jgi:hypothetical protein
MQSGQITHYLPLLCDESIKKIVKVGGYDAWEALPEEEKKKRDLESYQLICTRIGEQEFSNLSDNERREVSFFVWAGCCMHKEMNSVKGGNAAMVAFWETNGLQPPIKLYNRDNEAAALAGPSSAQIRANEVTQAGAVKTTSIAGAIFKHKDDKKGQHDTFRAFCIESLGFAILFPDTSNTRYQSHCNAAAVLIIYRSLLLQFLELVRDKKESGQFNHMENNLYRALQDVPTQTELCVLALYAQAVSHPYMRQVRGSERCNILDLGPLHESVKSHCRKVIDNPKLLVSLDASYETGSMDGQPWEQPDAFYAIQSQLNNLPHLEQALVAFFTGALTTWERFSAEFNDGGVISQLSVAERGNTFMESTNDHNEGALGSFRVAARHAPNLSLRQHNSRRMYKVNGTRDFIKYAMSKEDRTRLRRISCMEDSSGLEQQRRKLQAAYDRQTAAKRREEQAIRGAKRLAYNAILDGIMVVRDLNALDDSRCKLTVKAIDHQLAWHRRRIKQGGRGLVPTKLRDRAAKINALRSVVQDWITNDDNTSSSRLTDGNLEANVAVEKDFDSESDEE